MHRYIDKLKSSQEFSTESIMMDSELLKIKNEVQKKVKIYKLKKNILPDFVRKTRETILQNRIMEERRVESNIIYRSARVQSPESSNSNSLTKQ